MSAGPAARWGFLSLKMLYKKLPLKSPGTGAIIAALEVIIMGDKPTAWDEEFESEFFTEKEISESDKRVSEIQKEIDSNLHGHGQMLPFERIAVDA